MNDTIVAISTAVGDGAIGLIRLSGKQAIAIANRFLSFNLNNKASHTINYGYVVYEDEIIDEVLVSIMKAPKSFTTEDVVEISCHGGYSVINKILEISILCGARLASPGEFTKRAFLNGRIDLSQAEAISDLINAKTEEARKIAINNLHHGLKDTVFKLREDVLSVIANLEVNIDYPEYDDAIELSNELVLPMINAFENEVRSLLENSRNGQIYTEGLSLALVGKPNVGKSSILNILLDEDKAIVSSIAGTTRDVIEASMVINGVSFKIYDTAGIRDALDEIEMIGINKSMSHFANADIILFVIDQSDILNDLELEMLEKIKSKNHVVIVNKTDLDSKIDYDLSNHRVIYFSALSNSNPSIIYDAIKDVLNLNTISYQDANLITKTRHISILNDCLAIVNDVKQSIELNMGVDLLIVDLHAIWRNLGQLLGLEVDDSVIDRLFSDFCLGK